MEQTKEYHINNSNITIVFGNMLDSQAEVIVNSSGSKMTMGGGGYRKFQVKTLSSVEQAYLESIRMIEKKAKGKKE